MPARLCLCALWCLLSASPSDAFAQQENDEALTANTAHSLDSLPPVRSPRTGSTGLPSLGRSNVMAAVAGGYLSDGGDLSIFTQVGNLVVADWLLFSGIGETLRLEVPSATVFDAPMPERNLTALLARRSFATAGFRFVLQPFGGLNGFRNLENRVSDCLARLRTPVNEQDSDDVDARRQCRQVGVDMDRRIYGGGDLRDARGDTQEYRKARTRLVRDLAITLGFRGLYSPEATSTANVLGLVGEVIVQWLPDRHLDLFVSASYIGTYGFTNADELGAERRTLDNRELRLAGGIQVIADVVDGSNAVAPRFGGYFSYARNWWDNDVTRGAPTEVSGFRLEGAVFVSVHAWSGLSFMATGGLARPYGFDSEVEDLEFFLRLEPVVGGGV